MRSVIRELEQLCIDNPKEVVRRAEDAMAVARPSELPRLCSVCGAAFRRMAELDQAYHVLSKGMDLAKAVKDREAEAELLQRIACVFGDRGDYIRAMATSENAAFRFLEAGNLAGSGRCLFDQGMWLYYLEEFKRSIRICRSAYKVLPDRESNHRFSALQCMALCYLELGDQARARRYADLAIRFRGQIGVSMWAKFLWLDAKLKVRDGRFEAAEDDLQEALDLFLGMDAFLDAALACVEITWIVLRGGEPRRARDIASSYGSLLVGHPRLGDNRLASAAIMELVRCGVEGGNLERVLTQLKTRLERANARPRQMS